MKKFQVNDYIELLLINDETVIYVNNRKFIQCKFLLLNIPVEKISSLDEIESVDEAAEKLDKSLEPFEGRVEKIPPEVEFWGHCSNLQVWAENNYDTRLLHRNLAFSLLTKLSEVGDPIAKKVFKDELIKRIKEGNENVLVYLINEHYFRHFNDDEIESMIFDLNLNLFEKIFNVLKIDTTEEIIGFVLDILIQIKFDSNLLSSLVYESKISFIKNLLLLEYFSEHDTNINEQIYEIFKKIKTGNNKISKEFYRTIFNLFYLDSDVILFQMISFDLYEWLKNKDFLILFTDSKSKLKRNLTNLTKDKADKYQTNQGYLYKQLFTFLVILCKKIGKTEVFKFLKASTQESKIELQQGIRTQLNYLKLSTPRYFHIDKKKLEKHLLEFLKLIE